MSPPDGEEFLRFDGDAGEQIFRAVIFVLAAEPLPGHHFADAGHALIFSP